MEENVVNRDEELIIIVNQEMRYRNSNQLWINMQIK